MKRPVFFFLQLGFLLSCSIVSSQSEKEFIKIPGFSHPESVVFDADRAQLFISNIGGETEGDGFISRVSIEGEILDSLWIGGLDDPKGLLLLNGKLFVADNTRLIEMDVEGKQVTNEYSIPEAGMLNDIAADEMGNLYISDTRKNRIYKFDSEGSISEWLSTEELESPNGLLFINDQLWVLAWGNGEAKGNVLKIDPETKEIYKVSKTGIGNLDGLQQGKEGKIYLSDWASGKIYNIDSSGNVQEVVTSARSVGDILLLEGNGLLILPMNLQNEVWWYMLDL